MKTTRITRRQFHRRVGSGMLLAGLGSSLASDLGILTNAVADTDTTTLTFSKDLEPLVGLMQDTPLEKLQALVVAKLGRGDVTLTQLLQAASLANARSFGGTDYVGMHTLMAMNPAHAIAAQLPADRRALIVLKILHRNTSQIHKIDGELTMPAITNPAELTPERASAQQLRKAVHDLNHDEAEKLLAALAKQSPGQAYNDLLHVVADNAEVHRVVFAHRAWEILDLAGMENAETMFRQSLRYCLKSEERYAGRKSNFPRDLIPSLLDEYKLLDDAAPRKAVELDDADAWVESFSHDLFTSTAEQAARAVAGALAEGIDPEIIGEAISLTTNQLVLRDVGRTAKQIRPGKPEGSVHGDSIGVHASDSTNAWRGIARVSNRRNAIAALILAGYQAAHDRVDRGGNFQEWKPRPDPADLEKVTAEDPRSLLAELDAAIRETDQDRACAVIYKYGSLAYDPQPAIQSMLHHATREDGALHAEKYFQTATTDFHTTRPAHRWNHLVGLARVTASEANQTSPGYTEACELLGIPV